MRCTVPALASAVAADFGEPAMIIRNSIKRIIDLMEFILARAQLEQDGLQINPFRFRSPGLERQV